MKKRKRYNADAQTFPIAVLIISTPEGPYAQVTCWDDSFRRYLAVALVMAMPKVSVGFDSKNLQFALYDETMESIVGSWRGDFDFITPQTQTIKFLHETFYFVGELSKENVQELISRKRAFTCPPETPKPAPTAEL
jgi:hypothetical protein